MIKLDPSKYRTYKFVNMAFNISEHVDPSDTDLDIYVGLEHLDPECIHIRHRGVPSDVKGIKLRVYPRDIIFGKRRAYQRKAGLVEFNGICSAHAMVVRANPKVILPELFPFFMHSDLFMHRAVDISEGSLSPTIKWKIISEEEFRLPPLDEQKSLADLLWSVDKTIEHYIKLANEIHMIYLLQLKEIREHKERRKKIGDIANLHYGEGLKKKDRCNGTYPVIGSSGIVGKHSNFLVEGPGIIIGRKGSAGKIIWVKNNFWPIDTTFWVEIKNNTVMLKYFFYALKSINLASLTITTAIPGINRNDILSKKIYIPEYSIQSKIIKKFEEIWTTIDSLNAQIACTRNIQKQIINQIFGGKS